MRPLRSLRSIFDQLENSRAANSTARRAAAASSIGRVPRSVPSLAEWYGRGCPGSFHSPSIRLRTWPFESNASGASFLVEAAPRLHSAGARMCGCVVVCVLAVGESIIRSERGVPSYTPLALSRRATGSRLVPRRSGPAKSSHCSTSRTSVSSRHFSLVEILHLRAPLGALSATIVPVSLLKALHAQNESLIRASAQVLS